MQMRRLPPKMLQGSTWMMLCFGLSTAAAMPSKAAVVDTAMAPPINCLAPDLGKINGSRLVQGSGKASAILGGAISSLDLIRMEQAPVQSHARLGTILAATAAFGPRLVPAIDASSAVSTDCQSLVPSRVTAIPSMGLRGAVTADPENFLASKRVRITKTAFDKEWKRVGAEGVSRSTYKRLLGATPSAGVVPLEQVNRWVNRTITYTEDAKLFGRADYWAGARQTLKLGQGDCEDIALLKMQLLAAAGVRREDMILTIARDLVRQADHAVLIVRTPDGYRMLDNASDEVIDATGRQDYRAIISLSNRQAWLHGT